MSNLPLSEQYLRAAEEWCDLENAASLLEECKSSVLSQMMLKLGQIPKAHAEMKAKASDEWSEYIHTMVEARTRANKAKVYVEYLKMKGWEQTSRDATERLQARL